MGSARAGALLERQLTLARTRAHSATLQALGSSRFHAVADAVAVLASEVPLDAVAARGRVDEVLVPLAAVAETRLSAAVAALPAPGGHPVLPARGRRLARGAPAAAGPPVRAGGAGRGRHPPRVGGLGPGPPPRRRRGGRRLRDGGPYPRIAPATAYALGVLHADQRHEVEASRAAFQDLWQPAPV
ncbi:hypothetical protein GCM10020254_46480 [Streptomyces goshikiensis]